MRFRFTHCGFSAGFSLVLGWFCFAVAVSSCAGDDSGHLSQDIDSNITNDTASTDNKETLTGCSEADHQAVMEVATASGTSLGPVAEECYPTALSGTLIFESTWSQPPVAQVSATFTEGELATIDGIECEAVFPGEAPTFYECLVEFVCGCCRVKYEISSMVKTPTLTFITTGSAENCQALLNSGSFEYHEPTPTDTDPDTGCGGYDPCCEDCSSDCEWCGSDMDCFQECYGDCMKCCSRCY